MSELEDTEGSESVCACVHVGVFMETNDEHEPQIKKKRRGSKGGLKGTKTLLAGHRGERKDRQTNDVPV